MIRSAKFWVPMSIFQVAFGLTVFAITRQYYIDDTDKISARPAVTGQTSATWPVQSAESELEQLISSFPNQQAIEDPVATLGRADEFFTNGQYDRAADLYEQLVASGSGDVNTYNNLGITLHYLGRPTEALRVLNEGIALDSSYQRIWLTLGYINSQLGHTEQARMALTTAAQMGVDNDVGQSAMKMLDALP